MVTLPCGEVIEDAFPIFDSEYTAALPESMYLESDTTHFSYANEQLTEAINKNPALGNEHLTAIHGIIAKYLANLNW